jgi:hypothetical protein
MASDILDFTAKEITTKRPIVTFSLKFLKQKFVDRDLSWETTNFHFELNFSSQKSAYCRVKTENGSSTLPFRKPFG